MRTKHGYQKICLNLLERDRLRVKEVAKKLGCTEAQIFRSLIYRYLDAIEKNGAV